MFFIKRRMRKLAINFVLAFVQASLSVTLMVEHLPSENVWPVSKPVK